MNFQTDGHKQIMELSHPDYDSLPESVKLMHTKREYAWLGNEARARAVERECMPDHEVTE